MRIYVASSWRNERQPAVVAALRERGHEVYDFRNPAPGEHGFAWSEIDPEWQKWTPEKFREALHHPVARNGFSRDEKALAFCDAAVLVLPCGRSAHLEFGFAMGNGCSGFILMEEPCEPELMYAFADRVCLSIDELLSECEPAYMPAEEGDF